MNGLEASTIQCPYCWEKIDLSIDCSVEHQEYIEDCEVCCHPIVMDISISFEGLPTVIVHRES